jgi:hypothetical protein
MINIRKWVQPGFISLLILSGGLSACMNRESIDQATQIPVITIEPIFKEEPSPVPTLTPTPTEPPETANYPAEGYGPDDFPEQINPLTGLEAVDPALLDRRPMVVKIQNAPRDSRPAWGLSMADHVIEYYLEYGYTRFAAVFYGKNPEMIGPIRSARHADLHIVNMYDAMLIFGGAYRDLLDILIDSDFKDRIFQEGPNTSPAMFRYEPEGNNFLMVNPQELPAIYEKYGTDNSRQNLDGMLFQTQVPPGGEDVSRIFGRFSGVSYHYWDYVPESGKYLRFEETQDDMNAVQEAYTPAYDRLTGEEIYADNVIFVFVEYEQILEDAEVFDIHLEGEGDALVARDGKLYPVKWFREGREKILKFSDENGNPFPFSPGKTWIELFGKSSTVLEEEQERRITFSMP